MLRMPIDRTAGIPLSHMVPPQYVFRIAPLLPGVPATFYLTDDYPQQYPGEFDKDYKLRCYIFNRAGWTECTEVWRLGSGGNVVVVWMYNRFVVYSETESSQIFSNEYYRSESDFPSS